MFDFRKKNSPREISIFFVFALSFMVVAILPLILNHFIERETIWKYDSELSQGITEVFEHAKEINARESFRSAIFDINRNFRDALHALEILSSVYPYWEEIAIKQAQSPTKTDRKAYGVSYSNKFENLISRVCIVCRYAQGVAVLDSNLNQLIVQKNRNSTFHPNFDWLRSFLRSRPVQFDSTYWFVPLSGKDNMLGYLFAIRKFRSSGSVHLGVLFFDAKGLLLSALLQNNLDPLSFFVSSSKGEIIARFILQNSRFFLVPRPLARVPLTVRKVLADKSFHPNLNRKKINETTVAFSENLVVPGWHVTYLFSPTKQKAPLESLWNHYRDNKKHYFRLYVYFVFMLLLLTIGLSWLLLRLFMNKRKRFIAHLKDIENGKFSGKISGGRLKEFNQIAQSINQMSGQLRDTLEEIRKSERRYRLLLENAGDAILICSETGEIVEANPLCKNVLGLTPNELLHQNISKLFLTISLENYLSTKKNDRSSSSLEVPFHRKDGSQAFLQISFSEIDFNGKHYYQLILHDLTKQKKFEEQLVTQNRVLNLLYSMTRSIVSKPDLEHTYKESLSNLMELTRASVGAIYLFNEDKKRLQFAWGSIPDADKLMVNINVHQGVFGAAFRNRDMVVVDVTSDSKMNKHAVSKKLTEKYRITQYIGIPLLSEEGIVGLVLLGLARQMDFTTQFKSLLLSMGSQIGLLIQHAILVEQQRKRAYQLELLSQGGKIWIESQNFQAVLQKSVDHLHEKLGYWHVAIFSYVSSEKKLLLDAIAGGMTDILPIDYKQSEQKGILGEVLRKKRTYYTPEADKDPHYLRLGEHQSKSELAVPIKIGNEILGIVNIEGMRPYEFDEIDVATIETFADQLAVYYQFARRIEKEKQYARQMELVAQLGSILNSSLDSREFIQSVVEQLRTQMGYFYVSVYLVAEDDKEILVKVAESGGSKGRRPLGFRAHFGEGLLGKAAKTGLLVYSNDTMKNKDFIPVGEKLTGSEICAPIRLNGKVLGVLNVESQALNAFDEIDIHIIQTIANQLSQAIYKARLFSQLKYEKNKLDQILNQINQGIAMADSEGNVLFANSTFQQYFPEAKKKRILAHDFPFCSTIREDPQYEEFQIGKVDVIHVQFKHGERTFLVSVSQFVDFDFSRFILYVVNDISNLKNLEDEKIRGERLKLAMEMAGSIAHEINQPLTGIMGYISLIREELDAKNPLQDDLDEIERQADRINELIKKFQNVVKVRTKEYVGETQIIDWENSTRD